MAVIVEKRQCFNPTVNFCWMIHFYNSLKMCTFGKIKWWNIQEIGDFWIERLSFFSTFSYRNLVYPLPPRLTNKSVLNAHFYSPLPPGISGLCRGKKLYWQTWRICICAKIFPPRIHECTSGSWRAVPWVETIDTDELTGAKFW